MKNNFSNEYLKLIEIYSRIGHMVANRRNNFLLKIRYSETETD